MKNHQFLGDKSCTNTGSRGVKVSLEDKYQLVLLIIPGLEVLKRKSSTVILPECQAAVSHSYFALPGRGLEDSSCWREPVKQVSGGKPKSHLESALKPGDELLKITTTTAMAKRISAPNMQQFQCLCPFLPKGLCCGICSSVAAASAADAPSQRLSTCTKGPLGTKRDRISSSSASPGFC